MSDRPEHPAIEERLRSHYQHTADQLRLGPQEWSEVANTGRQPNSGRSRRRSQYLVAASVAALVAAAVTGAIVMSGRDNTQGIATAPTNVPSAATGPLDSIPATAVAEPPGSPSAPTEPAGAEPDGGRFPVPVGPMTFSACDDAPPVPSDFDSLGVTRDVRIVGVPLPADTPDGRCVIEHSTDQLGIRLAQVTVWVRTESDGTITGSFAVFANTGATHPENPGLIEARGVPVELGSLSEARYYEPDDSSPLSRLYVETALTGASAVVGWGLEKVDFVRMAEAALGEFADGLGGFDRVFEGWQPDFRPALSTPTLAQLRVGYADREGASVLRYAVVDRRGQGELADRPTLLQYAWLSPDPVFTKGDDRSQIFFPAVETLQIPASRLIIEQSDVQVEWTSLGAVNLDESSLAGIELTPAGVSDSRWEEIAWESGLWFGQG